VTANAREDEFFADHVDPAGNVHGISPSAAADHETTTRRWQLIGGLLLSGAGAAGITATVLFLTDDERPSAVGVGVTGSF
jgi:hypothetical protein